MESLDAAVFSNMDGLLDFSFDFGDEENNEEEDGRSTGEKRPTLVSKSQRRGVHVRLPDESDSDGDRSRSFPVLYEEDDDEEEIEELEWLSNQDVFPSIETFDFLSAEKPSYGCVGDNQKLQSPVSVLHETSSSSSNSSGGGGGGYGLPVRAARSMRRRRRRSSFTNLLLSSGDHQQQWWFWYQKLNNNKNNEKKGSCIIDSTTATEKIRTTTTTVGRGEGGVRRCQHCLAEKTPQWRAGPMGPKTLCNACGVRYKSGRLVPEYRPASSPSFSKDLHSNSHRKILEMRRKKQKKQQTSLQCLGNG